MVIILVREAGADRSSEMFRELFTRPTYRTPSNEYHPSGISMVNTMFSQVRTARIEEVGYLLGGKTGYDGPVSGLCLASLAEVGGEEYILITLGAGHGETSPALHLRPKRLSAGTFPCGIRIPSTGIWRTGCSRKSMRWASGLRASAERRPPSA